MPPKKCHHCYGQGWCFCQQGQAVKAENAALKALLADCLEPLKTFLIYTRASNMPLLTEMTEPVVKRIEAVK